jgi:hypothetical protein
MELIIIQHPNKMLKPELFILQRMIKMFQTHLVRASINLISWEPVHAVFREQATIHPASRKAPIPWTIRKEVELESRQTWNPQGCVECTTQDCCYIGSSVFNNVITEKNRQEQLTRFVNCRSHASKILFMHRLQCSMCHEKIKKVSSKFLSRTIFIINKFRCIIHLIFKCESVLI